MDIVEYKGKMWLKVQVLISKIYASTDFNILARENNKGVSMEIGEIVWNEDGTVIEAFKFHGITVLGNNRTPAIAGANIEMLAFETKSNKIYNDYLSGQPDNNKNITKKEVNMAKLEDSKNEIEKDDDKEVSMADKEKKEQEDKEQDEKQDNKEEKEMSNSDDNKDKMSYEELEKAFNALEKENKTLKSTLASFEEEKKKFSVNSILFEIENTMPHEGEDENAELTKEAKKFMKDIKEEEKNYSYSEINNYSNYCKVQAFEFLQKHGIVETKKKDGVTRIARNEMDFSGAVDSKPDPHRFG